ncbi:hypothetical protein [Streptacidiphilus carbonis]|uniref:hypothetical protein n=1 Tax=Streptacidiphilus carbonis TaxID=105422 RepID=UPI0005A7219D|nr:hypothetical protein [Streptacidiphilus carbonis]
MGLFSKPDPPAVIGVLTTPPASSWWKLHRHQVLLAVGLVVGFWLAVHTGAAASPSSCPTPGPTSHSTARPGTTAPTLIHVPPAKGAKP